MTKINKEEVKKVAHLARLELNENEINNHAEQLEKMKRKLLIALKNFYYWAHRERMFILKYQKLLVNE